MQFLQEQKTAADRAKRCEIAFDLEQRISTIHRFTYNFIGSTKSFKAAWQNIRIKRIRSKLAKRCGTQRTEENIEQLNSRNSTFRLI